MHMYSTSNFDDAVNKTILHMTQSYQRHQRRQRLVRSQNAIDIYLKRSRCSHSADVTADVRKSLSIKRASDFWTSLQYGEWKIKASAEDRLNCGCLSEEKQHNPLEQKKVEV